jgi:gamma-glutamyltranspeptidase/glutathione hydrolase
MKHRLGTIVLGVLAAIPAAGQGHGSRPVVSGLNGMVTSNHPAASAAGMRVLLAGGNAFDAAVATAAATSIVDPANSTLGGNGFATIYVAETREVHALNFFGTAPGASKPELFTEESLNEGILSSPVPSNLKGYQALLERFGTLALADVLAPAIELAEDGFLMTPLFHDQIERYRETFERYETSAKVFLPGGKVPAVGTLFKQPDAARTLRQIAERGADDVYKGELARRIVDFYQKEGGILSFADLERYEARWLEPLSIRYRDVTVYTQPPNSSAVALLEELNIMQGFDNRGLGHNSAPYLHRFMEAVRLALADRNRFVADTDAVAVPLETLLSEAYADRQRARIDSDKASPVMRPGDLESEPDGATTHLTVVDRGGNMVALTQTLGAGYGSKVIVGDTGLIFSNQMRHMHLDPQSPSQIRGGIRPRSNQSPTIVLRDRKPVMALGTPGGDGIWQRLAQVIVNVLDFDMSIQEAIDAPRFVYGGPQETGDAIAPVWRVEQGIAAKAIDALTEMGHRIEVVPREGGAVNGITRDPETGVLVGGADPRGRSYAMGY